MFSIRDVRKFKEYFFEPKEDENIDLKIYIVIPSIPNKAKLDSLNNERSKSF